MNWETNGRVWPNRELSRFVTTPRLRFHVQESGPTEVAETASAATRTVLLLHGAGASTHSWRDMLPDLARDHHVVALDLPGQGFSRTTVRNRFGLEAMAEDIAALLKSEEITPDILVGHSAGGAIAAQLALDLPAPPKALVALNGAFEAFSGLSGAIFPVAAKLLSFNPLTAPAFAHLARAPGVVHRLLAATGSAIDPCGESLYRRLISDSGHVDATLAMMAQWDLQPLRDRISGLRMPVLLLVGGRDHAVPPETSERVARLLQNAEIRRIESYGHLLHEEAPRQTAEEIRKFERSRVGAVAPQ